MRHRIKLTEIENEAVAKDDDVMPYLLGWIACKHGVSWSDIQYGYTYSHSEGIFELGVPNEEVCSKCGKVK